jgi:hypothetical protein
MTTPFNQWNYIFPPRPKTAIPFADAPRYADGRWQAQLKLNGTRNLIAVSPDGEVDFWNRHKERHRAWTPPTWIADEVRARFACGKWTVLDSELLHSKHASVKDTLYLFGALVLGGQHLVGETYEACYAGLVGACGAVGPDVPGYGGYVAEAGRGLWLARMIPPDRWPDAWDVASRSPVAEGLVLKRVKARLEPGRAENNNGTWMIRCRKASKSFAF